MKNKYCIVPIIVHPAPSQFTLVSKLLAPQSGGGAGYESVITLCSDKNWLQPGLLIRISQTTYNSKPSPRYIYPKVVKRKNENESFEPVSVRVKTLVLGQHRFRPKLKQHTTKQHKFNKYSWYLLNT